MNSRAQQFLMTILFTSSCIFGTVYGQNKKAVKIPRAKEGFTRMSEAMLIPKTNVGIFELKYSKGRVSHSTYAVVNYETHEFIAKFTTKKWTYMHSSWVENDSLLYLSKGMWITKKMIFNLHTGEKIKTKFNFRCNEPVTENGQGKHFGADDFYCTSDIVYWENKRMYFDENTHALIIDTQ